MMLLIHSLLRRISGCSRSGRTRRRKSFSSFGIQSAEVEVLESRRLLSALTVTTTADSGAGSLRAEIAAAHSGDTINFASSLKGTITLSSGQLVINKSLDIEGPGANHLAVSGGGNLRVFEVDAGAQVTLSRLTIENGAGFAGDGVSDPNADKGGDILNFGTLTVSNCVVTHNDDSFVNLGGGIFNAGTLSLSGSTVTLNIADEGGGIYNDTTGTLLISNSSVSNNLQNDIYNLGTMTVTKSKK
jgi:hypothetical protein